VETNLDLTTRIGDLKLASPLIGASGVFGYGSEYGSLVDFRLFGAVVAKTVTLKAREGNPPPRLVDLHSGILNSIGLENVGCGAFLAEKLPRVELPCALIASIGGNSTEEYGAIAGRLAGAPGVAALEVNISCPNVEGGGIAFGSNPATARRVVETVRAETDAVVIVKVPPLVVGLVEVCDAVCLAGADALTVANTYPAIAIDTERERPVLGAVSGGLSGGAIRPISQFLVWKAAGKVSVPIIASGGIESGDDAIEYILAGASALQIGSVIFKDANAPALIIDGLRRYMQRKGYESIADFSGNARAEEG
jgi:dihydroorotate dehydrogenase (NAD+) catalytic subunit